MTWLWNVTPTSPASAKSWSTLALPSCHQALLPRSWTLVQRALLASSSLARPGLRQMLWFQSTPMFLGWRLMTNQSTTIWATSQRVRKKKHLNHSVIITLPLFLSFFHFDCWNEQLLFNKQQSMTNFFFFCVLCRDMCCIRSTQSWFQPWPMQAFSLI